MRYYKMRRGEYLHERVPDLKGKVEEYFGEVTGTEEHEGMEMYKVEDTMIFSEVLVGVDENESRKDRLAVHFEEEELDVLTEEGRVDMAQDAMSAKNDFLEEVTGRDAKDRRDSMKREVEDADADVDV